MSNALFTQLLKPAAQTSTGLPWWLWLIIIILVIIVLWLAFTNQEEKPQEEKQEPAVIPPMPDDLTKIEGIGPKISSILQAAGVMTFSDLSALEAGKIKEMLTEAGIRLGDPTTWPEQAKLASDGAWEALEKLQDELKGGRKE